MRIAFTILVSFHALLHALGFLKAFGLADLKQLTTTISKPMGVVWLFACILFVVYAVFFAFKNNLFWLVGLVAVIFSQIAINSSWQDAKIGTLINVIVLCVSLAGFGSWNYFNNYNKEVSAVFQQDTFMPTAVLSENDIQQLPEQIKKYIRFVGAVGKPKVSHFKAEFIGEIREDAYSPWMPFTCIQFNFLKEPTRLFFMKAKMKGFPIGVFHKFRNGKATMDVRLFSLIDIQRLEGAEMNVSETVTFFNDMCVLAPASLIDNRIKWLGAEKNTVKASFTNKEITVTAVLYFDDRGALVNFISQDRYAGNTGKKYAWATPLKNYQQFEGQQIMEIAETIYSYPDGDFIYGNFTLKSISCNPTGIN